MKKIILFTIGVFLIVLLLSLVSIGNKNTYTRDVGDKYEVILMPIESESYAKMQGAEFQEVNEYDEFHYYFLRISEKDEIQSELFKNLHSSNTLGSSISYLSHEISKDLFLVTDSDTLNCAMSHWERTYNIRKDITLTVAFKKKTKEKPIKFIWNDNLLNGIPIKFSLNN